MMKWTLLCAAAACAAAVGLPCDIYCTRAISGIQNIAYQPECNCMYQESERRETDDSAVYYEPAEYISLPTLTYERPFFILNPYVALREKHFAGKAYQRQVNAHKVPSTQIKINIENTQTLHKRKEKALYANNIRTAPVYLDINIEPDDSNVEASTQQFLPQDFWLTEQGLAQCADLHVELSSRKNHDTILLNNRVAGQYKHLSSDDLIKKIEEKCSQITFIIEKNLREIKEKQPIKANHTFSSVEENNKNQRNNDIPYNNKRNDGPGAVEKTSQLSVHLNEDNRSGSKEYDENQEHVIVIYTDSESDENTTESLKILPTRVSSTTTAWTPYQDITPLSDITKNDIEDVLTTTKDGIREIHPTTPMYNEQDKYTDYEHLNIETRKPVANFESSPPVNILRAKESGANTYILENERFKDLEVGATEIKRYKENRTHYMEDEVPLAKIITHEFNNDTVQSFINGTEDIPNGDFEDETSYATNKPTERIRNNRSEIDSTSQDTDGFDRNDITGNLYFVFKNHQIPTRFIQKPNGNVHVGIDGAMLCDKLNQEGKQKSALLTTLCNRYKSDNCTSGI